MNCMFLNFCPPPFLSVSITQQKVLREQPENIYEFGYNYFVTLQRNGSYASRSGQSKPNRIHETASLVANTEVFREHILQLFQQHDVDRNGKLDHKEFKQVYFIKLSNRE